MSFENFQLHPIIERNLGLMGFRQAREIQRQTILPMLAGRDVIGLAEAGSGKTVAFITPIANHLISEKPARAKGRPIAPASRLRALILCPTRELAQQVADEAAQIAQGSVLRTACAYGKVALSPQIEALERGVDLLVATPGRVRELIDAGALSLSYIKHLAIDEADRMLDLGFLPQVTAILETIPSNRQTALFTATMPREIEELSARFLNDPVRVEIGRHTTPVKHVQQHMLPVDEHDKVALLLHLLEHQSKEARSQAGRRGVLVFCRTKRRVGWVGTALERNNITVGMLHGDRSQAQRQRALDRFANDELRVLVATDVAGRGLHIPSVKTVVNYDVPTPPEEYVHRIGRAGHGGKTGEAFTFLTPDDRDRRNWRSILDSTGSEIFAESVPGFEPTIDVRRKARSRTERAAELVGEPEQLSNRARKRKAKPQKRSRKSRPIKKNQMPGQGVVRRAGGSK